MIEAPPGFGWQHPGDDTAGPKAPGVGAGPIRAGLAGRDERLGAQVPMSRQLADAVPGMTMMLVDRDLRVLVAAGGGFARVGLVAANVEGAPLDAAVASHRVVEVRRRCEAALGGMPSVEDRVERDGSIFWVRYLPVDVVGSEERYALVVSQDMSERDQARRALERSEAAYAAVFEQSVVGNVLVGLDGRLVRMNAAFCTMLGRSPHELEGLGWPDITHPDDVADNALKAADLLSGTRSSIILEKRFVHASGRPVDVIMGVTLVRDEHGSPLHLHSQIVDVSELRASQEELRRLASTDVLTGLPNRRATQLALEEHCADHVGRRPAGGVILLDLDRFKSINDTHGHGAGDEALRAVAGQWRQQLRRGDLLGRIGGDELLVLLPDATAAEARVVASALVAPVVTGRGNEKVTACAGVAMLQAGDDGAALVARADRALLASKAVGPGTVTVA